MQGTSSTGPHRALEIAGLAAALLVTTALVSRLVHDGPPGKAVWIPAALGLGWLLADLLSGLVHWAGDRCFHVDTPLIGRAFVAPFRAHHVDPTDITRHGFVETNGNNALASLTGLAPALLIDVAHGAGAFVVAVVVATMNALLATNQLHKWAHAARPPPLIARLQRAGLVLSPAHHARHHAPPHDVCYCITTGWWNGPLDRGARRWRRWRRPIAARGARASSRSSPRST